MRPSPVLIATQDVDGAPVRLGETVRISSSSPDASWDERFEGQRGVVVALVYDEPSRQYPHAPLIQVRVEGLGEDLFFPRELKRFGMGEGCGLTSAPPGGW